MTHHVEATSKREPSLPPTPPVSLQTRSNEILDELTQQFSVSTQKMRAIVNQFVSEMQKGLHNEGETVAMIPTFVTGRPTGQEKGQYLALDLGGTYLRVCEVSLHGNRDFGIHQQKYKVPGALKLGEMTQLCDFIAECVNNFLSEQGHDNIDPEAPLQLGFTFSFPVFQTSINRGVLKQWTKGFSCKNAVDKDVVVMLQDAFSRKKVPVNIAAIVNDTVGTLMALGYRQPETAIGVILGTGTNACYYEKIDKIQKWSGGKTAFEDMVINTEWGMFDCERTVLPLTIHDCKVDRESINPRQQMFEKMISGMYLGEITRNCILHYVDRQMMFKGFSSTELNQPYTFETEYMSTIQADDSSDLAETRHILEDVLKLPGTTLDDRRTVKAIIELVGRRAARLSACGLAAVMELSDVFHSGCTIAIDGSLYEHYPGFDNTMMQALIELYGPEIEAKISFSLARDGSGLGAAIVAMIAHKAAQQQQQQQTEEHDSSL
ncbi:hexokinase 2 [Lichtheimia corymbifera JMRC:FSU:9682]|uniref:Phosphotransferase n=1 Tax=Lichtheimia corymbifera JMRC:FSU:9682 TaxID=1263082 RepID=A0A068S2X3_9FUNG|nr:hexokinase 2 [Lichtheimia corymbifera JMRC:FSU:9682]